MPTILFVCTGNTCRSPMAEHLLRDMFKKRDITGWKIKSAGISAWPGGKISSETLKVLKDEEINAVNHEVTQVNKELLVEADIILTMTETHKKHLKNMEGVSAKKLFTLKELIEEDEDLDILDPYGQSLEVYKKTKDEIKKYLEEFQNKILNKEILRGDMMKIAIGSDHAGYQLKEEIKSLLEEKGLFYQDMGTDSEESVDYPDFAYKVAKGVADNNFDKGILICGTGIGMSIAANKVNGVRAALCHNVFSAKSTRNHNDSNVLTMGSRVVAKGLAREIVKAWLGEEFDGGRHQRRVEKINDIEKEMKSKN
ncbi:MAG: ribose 5-phosphate isomerase B [Bacillota bacterium]